MASPGAEASFFIIAQRLFAIDAPPTLQLGVGAGTSDGFK